MKPLKLKVGFARFPYSGNGGSESEHPAIGDWLCANLPKIFKDQRCEPDVWNRRFADTPISMTRNQAFQAAIKAGVDVLVMIDSDQIPDLYVPVGAKPWWDTCFDFLYDHYRRGPCVIFGPYCGQPPHPVHGGGESVHAFRWTANTNDLDSGHTRLLSISREEAAVMTGISEVAAGPTGMMMVDLRCTQKIAKPWFDYEWKDDGECCPACRQRLPGPRAFKATTEDVYFTRNCSLSGVPVYCNWDAWAGHVKPRIVGRPIQWTPDQISDRMYDALRRLRSDEKVREINPGKSAEEVIASLGLTPLNGKAKKLPKKLLKGGRR